MKRKKPVQRAPSGLKWESGTEVLPCPVCGVTDGKARLATFPVNWQDDPLEIVRCGTCGAVILSTTLPPSVMYDEQYVDRYVEQTAGVEAIASILAKVAAGPGARMLDVGCGYGFGVDLGERLRGWHGVGLDPSIASRRGRSELGIDIREGILEASFEPGQRFDVILASELVEHLPDPRSFVRLVADRLTDDGVVVVTTPDGSLVRPDTPETELLHALTLGDHRFLVDEAGLCRLLEAAGLLASVWTDGTTLVAVAARTPEAMENVRRDGTIVLSELAEYCTARARSAAPGSPLAVGMAARAVKFLAYAGDFDAAGAALPALRRALLDRYQVDLDEPATLSMPSPPPILALVGYFAGVVASYVTGDLPRADALFAASAAAGRYDYDVHGMYTDPETARFEAQSLGERAMVRARYKPRTAGAALRALDESAARSEFDPVVVEDFHRRTAELLRNPPPPSAPRSRLRLGRR